MEDFKYCRVCLVTDVKMFSLETSSSDSIGVVFSHLAQIPIFDRDQHVCFECASFLHKFQEFKSKCLRAHYILSKFKFGSTHITKEAIKKIDRKINKLESNLRVTPVSVQYEVAFNEDTEIDIKQNEGEENKELEVSVKIEEANPDIDDKYDFDEPLNDYNEDFIDATEEIIIEQSKTKPRKKPKKEPKTKKRKFKTVIKSEDDFSDDEPLSKSVSKIMPVTKTSKKKNGLNISYFDDYATVVFLTPEDARKEVLLRKESNNYKMSQFKCDLCYRGFEAKSAFENHTKKHSVKVAIFFNGLNFHTNNFYSYQAKTHVSLHKGKKYPCKHCGEIFRRNQDKGERPLLAQVENDKLGPKCEDCDVHFTSEEAWKRHLVLSSKHKVSNGCKFCGDTFPNLEDLKAHLRVHSRKQMNRSSVKLPSACLICDKWLVNRVEYKIHVTSEHPHTDEAKKISIEDQTPFVCEQQCFLTYHQRKHTGERPYKCSECDKTFQLAGALSIHRSVHTRRRAHKCDMCARVFTFKSALNKHMKVHLGIRPHKCAICDKGFIHMCDLKLHIKYVHDKVPWPKKKTKRNIVDEGTYMDY
ncbi:hypothetical protein HF086_012377 [Spodoptera exigua]|uniref:Uncharacterized protein n=1 Tax=Spodoptera exigua TaxID=7107 RepID=A0A922SCH4_SPOEX|nr:hypothetical protein HF086_012377 [Spodoptera exigua]